MVFVGGNGMRAGAGDHDGRQHRKRGERRDHRQHGADPLVADDSLRAKRGTAARGRAIDFGLERW